MDWQEILTILIPLFALMGLVYNRIEKKADDRHTQIKDELKEMRSDIKSIEQRLTRLEGRFEERGYWESREWRKTGTEDRKLD